MQVYKPHAGGFDREEKVMNRRNILKAGVALGAAYATGFAGAALAQSSQRLRVANFYATEHSMNRALRDVFVPRLEALSDSALTASIHDNSSLGAEGELTEGLRLGTIEMGITGGLLSASRPRLAVLELPFLFRDFDHAWAVFDSDIGDDLATEFEAEGIKVLAWVGNGFRAISNSVRPLNSVDDMAGLRLRMPENRVYIETGRALGRWQFLTHAQIDAQIGMIHYVREDFKTAQPYLERALSRLWIPKAMLGALQYKKKDVAAMRQSFEKAVSVGKKQGLAWSVYAWCEWKLGNAERAIDILGRGDKALKGDDEKIKANLLSLQNGKKLKMKPYGDQWYQFHLETMPALKQQNVRFARR